MFSVVSVCSYDGGKWSHMTITYDALDFTVQGTPRYHPAPHPRYGTSLYGEPPWPQPCPSRHGTPYLVAITGDLLKLVHLPLPHQW